MTDQLSFPAKRSWPTGHLARLWCGVALAGLVGGPTWAAQGTAPAPAPPPPGAQGANAPQLVTPAPPPPPAPAPENPLPAPIDAGANPNQTPNTVQVENPVPPPAPTAEPIEPGPVGIVEVPDATHEINVFVGQAKLVEGKRPFTRVVIVDPTIADVQLLDADQANPRLLNIYGRRFGLTSLSVWDDQEHMTSYKIRVTVDTRELEQRIRTLMPGAEVKVRQLGMQVILEGQVPDTKTMSEVLSLTTTTLFGNAIGAPMAGGGSGMSSTAAGGAGMGGMQGGGMMSGGGTMGGGMMSGGMGGGMMGQAGAFAGGGAIIPPGTIINRVHVPGPRQVLLHVKIAELNRTALRQIGVSWLDARNQMMLGSTIGNAGTISALANPLQTSAFTPGAFTQGAFRQPGIIQPVTSAFRAAGTAAPNAISQLFGVFNAGEFNIFINALRQNQLAKILAEPNLMALDGQPARFMAGGSFPFPVPQSTAVGGASVAVTIQFRDFGAILQFIPHILANDVIRLDVAPTFSELNPATGVTVLGTTVPGINQREARTVVELREGQTLAIAGLLQTRTNGSTTRVPILGDMPIVGPLFSQTNITTVETELIVLVTPELVAPMERNEVPPSPGDRVLQPNDYEFYFLGRIEGKTGHPFRSTVQEHDPLNVMKHYQSENIWVVGPHGHAD